MGRDSRPDRPKATAPDPHVVSDDFLQNSTEISSAVRQAALARKARAANHRRGEFRWFEFRALNVRWDSNAYGSAAWATVTAHGTLLLLEAAETIAFTWLLFGDHIEERDLAGASDNALYWYFMTGVWIPLYVVVYLSPYFM